MLGASDPLPHRPRRIVVAGVSGTGKTTLAARIGEVLGIEHVEIDALFHGEDWEPRPTFAAEVDAFTAREAWVTEWQYSSARPLLAARADLMVWLDLPFRVTLWRLTGRTLRRRFSRQTLWNGNREAPLHTFLTDRGHVVRWAIATRHRLRTAVPDAATAHPGLVVVRLHTQREVDHWTARLRDAQPGR
ncbi:AAA family ATPase [Nocardioides rubriscoriae]|uniref:AAA family ATPase n=1 Tax=Nocardioides rubriscoriae TaxID=642762 RepID=UPI0011DFE547|nr:AAA family ATPase [Nocardioides rubriscoriae]